jgi:hypothetical protein
MPNQAGNNSGGYAISPEVQAVIDQAYKFVGTSQDCNGYCLKFVRSIWGAAGMGGDPNHNIKFVPPEAMHSDMNPPVGAPVWFTGGDHGHVAIVSKYVNGVPYIISTDFPVQGKVGEAPLSQIIHSWGNLTYRGWSTSINNKTILRGVTHGPGDGGVTVGGQSANSTSTSSTTTGTNPGSGTLGSVPANASDVWDNLQEQFGLTSNLLSLDKTDPKKGFTLAEAFTAIRTGGDYFVNGKRIKGTGAAITDPIRAANILAQTDWFKTYGTDVTKKLAAEKNGLGSFKEGLNAQTASLKDQLAAAGVSLGAKDLATLARDSYVYGLSDSQILDKATSMKGIGYTGGGTTGGALQYLDGLAEQNGVSISAGDRLAWERDLTNKNKTPQDYEKMIRDHAANQYSVFADQIRAGQNLRDLTKPYRDMTAQLLEVNPDSVTWNDPLFKDGKAFQTVDPKTGQMTTKPLWQFRQDVMKDARWQRTDNAKDQYTSFGQDVLKRFGMVA